MYQLTSRPRSNSNSGPDRGARSVGVVGWVFLFQKSGITLSIGRLLSRVRGKNPNLRTSLAHNERSELPSSGMLTPPKRLLETAARTGATAPVLLQRSECALLPPGTSRRREPAGSSIARERPVCS